ncbi:MAG: CHAT domain-containing protein [Candidatus Electrothrix aestuarii]|uniref:CHAT domain-containing protein n=1 Tax=Candidatus Electrothrix aestuarii TaxID=3062594 RepID=A0AAU8LRI0_9BACT|nr:CHAT domain-containing protein [Candidatus Electrothrix aestuarii]
MSFDFNAIKIEEAKKKWGEINDKLSRLEKQRVQETRAEEIFRLEQLIKKEKEERQQLEQELAELQKGGSPAASQSTPEQEPSSSSTDKTTILFLAANPMNTARLRLDEEVKKISNDLRLSKERDNLILSQEWAVTSDSLMQAILDTSPQIVHFSGHGELEGICLDDGRGMEKMVSAAALANLFRLFKDSVQCVLLNACYSLAQAEAIKEHIPHVIGMSSAIPDTAAISFASGFYKAVGAGRDIPFAFELGKAAVLMQGEEGDELPRLL